MRQVKAHDAVMGLQEAGVGSEVGRGSAQGLHIDSPFLRIQVEGSERTLLAQHFILVNELVACVVSALVSGAWADLAFGCVN